MFDLQSVSVFWGGRKKVQLWADVAFEGHYHFFPNRVYGGVSHLREALFEIVVKHPGLIGHNRQCCVVAHRTKGISKFSYHGI